MALVWDLTEADLLNLGFLENQIAQMMDKSSLEETLKVQLAEVEMLQSIFSNPGELSVDDYSVFADFDDFIAGKSAEIPPQLNFCINLVIDNVKFEVNVDFPHEYPHVEPEIFVRSDKFNRSEQQRLNSDLAKYIKSIDRGEVCVFSAVSWLQENALRFCELEKATAGPGNRKGSKQGEEPRSSENMFSRLWIYSHHIYSRGKRRELQELAQEYSLTGFCLPGRPGVVCVEGLVRDCEDFWIKVRGMNWKKIVCAKKEEEELNDNNPSTARKFPGFQEVCFTGTKIKHREIRMDFGEFFKYLVAHNCEHVIKDIFGVDGKDAKMAATA